MKAIVLVTTIGVYAAVVTIACLLAIAGWKRALDGWTRCRDAALGELKRRDFHLRNECPRYSWTEGDGVTECEKAGLDATTCNLAAAAGWSECPEPAYQTASR